MSTKFTCRFCKEQFDVPKALYKHLQSVHNGGVSRDNRNCPICGVLCSKYESYRDHLLYIHGQTEEGLKLSFKSLNDFLVWKTELEIKNNCKYVLQASPKVLPSKEKKYFYQCDRANSKSKDKKTSVVMKTCSSVISVLEGSGVFKIEYWDRHSGHEESSTASEQNELEAAISSVEMVNAISESDDSLDKSEELSIPESSSAEKQTIFAKGNSSKISNLKSSSISNILQKSKGKTDVAKKKNSNNSILYSLASVACGKGIVKKPSNKENESKNAENQSSSNTESNSKSIENSNNDSIASVKQKSDLVLEKSITEDKFEESTVKSVALSSPSSATTKVASGPHPIAPKIPVDSTTNSVFPANNALSNQFVIMNPADQNSLNSSFATGQNLLLSLGPIGQNVSNNATSQIISQNFVADQKNALSVGKGKSKNSSNVITSDVFTPVKNSSKISKKTKIASSSSNVANNSTIALTSGLNNSPVILSSLPVGSTFMSLNNNLIPIASPSGAFIPTSLPPNIVLTPVVSGASLPNSDPSKTAINSVNTVSSTPQNNQTQSHFAASSTVAITVSSIVKEPLYTVSPIKQKSSIITSSTSPVSFTPTSKISRQKHLSKFVPITTAGRISPHKNMDKSASSSNSIADIDEISMIPDISISKIRTSAPNKSQAISPLHSSTPKTKLSARKRISKGPKKSTVIPKVNTVADSSSFSTKVVNSRLHLTPICSNPSVTMAPQMNAQKPGTMLFESSAGEIYMLEPIDDDVSLASSKSISADGMSNIKINRGIQTTESSSSSLQPKFQKKKGTTDSTVMLKVKCFQLEMKYLSSQTACKRLKVDLTKERLKNAALTGEKVQDNIEDDNESTTAAEIIREIEDKYSGNNDVNVYTMTKTSVLRSLYEDLEELCVENRVLHKELESYRAHDKFYKNLKRKLYDEEF